MLDTGERTNICRRSNDLPQGATHGDCAPGDIWQCLGTSLVVTLRKEGRVPVALVSEGRDAARHPTGHRTPLPHRRVPGPALEGGGSSCRGSQVLVTVLPLQSEPGLGPASLGKPQAHRRGRTARGRGLRGSWGLPGDCVRMGCRGHSRFSPQSTRAAPGPDRALTAVSVFLSRRRLSAVRAALQPLS